MKPDNAQAHLPMPGIQSCCLGVRDNEIRADSEEMVSPGSGGMSVNDSIEKIPPAFLPPQYAAMVEGAAGKKSHKVWTMGRGVFKSGPFALRLELRCDEDSHGLIEADQRMQREEYIQALSSTQSEWRIIEPL
jgi:hypothetical protein